MTMQDRVRLKIYMRRFWDEYTKADQPDIREITKRIRQVADWYGVTFLEAARGDEMLLIDTAQSVANIDALCVEYLQEG